MSLRSLTNNFALQDKGSHGKSSSQNHPEHPCDALTHFDTELQGRQNIEDIESAMNLGDPDDVGLGALEVEAVLCWHIEEPQDQRQDSADNGHDSKTKYRAFHAPNLSLSSRFR